MVAWKFKALQLLHIHTTGSSSSYIFQIERRQNLALQNKKWQLFMNTAYKQSLIVQLNKYRIKECKIWGSHDGDYEECRRLGWNAVWLLQ
jgi:hypothetical protein